MGRTPGDNEIDLHTCTPAHLHTCTHGLGGLGGYGLWPGPWHLILLWHSLGSLDASPLRPRLVAEHGSATVAHWLGTRFRPSPRAGAGRPGRKKRCHAPPLHFVPTSRAPYYLHLSRPGTDQCARSGRLLDFDWKPSSWVVGGLADRMVGGWEGDRLGFCARVLAHLIPGKK